MGFKKPVRSHTDRKTPRAKIDTGQSKIDQSHRRVHKVRSSNFTEDRSTPPLVGSSGAVCRRTPAILRFRRTTSPHQYHVFDGVSGRQVKAGAVHLKALPEVSALLNLEELSMKGFMVELKAGEIAEMELLKPETSPENLNSSSVMDEDVLEGTHHPNSHRMGEFGTRLTSCLAQSTVSRGSGLYLASNAFFAENAKLGMVQESKSPHSTPTFCVRKPNGNLNNATVPAQTPIPLKDVLLNNMSSCTLYSALDLVDGYYQIQMRESDIPLTAVSTPSGMLWEWLVMPQGLTNAPTTFNRLVTQLFRSLRTFAQTYFDDIFVHSRAFWLEEVCY
ncbi:Pol protein [Phytophthora palmivora]|uniref:Pol protein n=1 Tax=Phytophthora palmivora TaxID=4796 RepID=A0A2P4XSB8_9STRA|nr:Pol protein [Phytophthora palmivora]